jgi:hypothetical protein
MSKSNNWENGLLLLLFNNTTYTLVGDAAGLLKSAADGNLYVSLHTSDPGEAGDQTTNETSYTDYARVAVVRTSSGWTVTNNSVVNAAAITFPECGTTGATLTHFGVGTSASGAGKLLYSNALDASRTISTGTAPYFAAGSLTVTED